MIYGTEKNLTEHGDKIPDDEKNKIREAIATVRKAMEGDDPGALDSAGQALTTASQKLAEEMYKQASASGPGASPTGAQGNGGEAGKSGDEKVVDAEFEEVDKDKKS